jgi:hypothetical protein
VPVCSKYPSIGHRKEFDDDFALWFLPSDGSSKSKETECVRMLLQSNGKYWSTSIQASQFRNLQNLFEIKLDFGSVGFTKYYSMDNINGFECPAGFNTNEWATMAAEYNKIRSIVMGEFGV